MVRVNMIKLAGHDLHLLSCENLYILTYQTQKAIFPLSNSFLKGV